METPQTPLNWHRKHKESSTTAQRLADAVANYMGSWKFIILQSIFVVVWMGLNITGIILKWDAYPFILLNLVFSTQAAYAAPIIMMSQNRASERDRHHAEADFRTNKEAKREIEKLQIDLSRIENDKLNRILELLEKK
jgi:uncharacterized membrane protein